MKKYTLNISAFVAEIINKFPESGKSYWPLNTKVATIGIRPAWCKILGEEASLVEVFCIWLYQRKCSASDSSSWNCDDRLLIGYDSKETKKNKIKLISRMFLCEFELL